MNALKHALLSLGLDTNHFVGQAWNKGRVFGPKRDVKFYLVKGKRVQSHKLRQRLLKEGVLAPVCVSCGLEQWMGGPIPLELEHRDGDHCNNELSNLECLCPNCHALTPTYRGKNKGKS